MIYRDKGNIIIECPQTDYTEHHNRMMALIHLLKTQHEDHINADTTYYAFNLLEDMIPQVHYIDPKKIEQFSS